MFLDQSVIPSDHVEYLSNINSLILAFCGLAVPPVFCRVTGGK